MNAQVLALAREISRLQAPSPPWRKLIKSGETMPDGAEIWANDIYEVTVRRSPGAARIGINSFDCEPRHDWREFQNIKNDVCGPEWEAVEVYPPESQLIDPSNYYILWAGPKGTFPMVIRRQRKVEGPEIASAPQRGWVCPPS